MQQLGAPEEVIEAAQAAPEPLEIYPENHRAVTWALRVIRIGMLNWAQHVCMGPDITAIAADAKLSRNKHSPDDYDKMLTVIRGFTNAVNKRE